MIATQRLQYKIVSSDAYITIRNEFGITLNGNESETFCYGAFYTESLVGFVYFISLLNNEYLIKYINVLPVFRNQGIGSELLKHAILSVKSKKGNLIKAVYNNATYDISNLNGFFRKNGLIPVNSVYVAYKIHLHKFYERFTERFFSSNNNPFEKHIEALFYNELNEEQQKSISLSSEIILEESMPFDKSKKLSKELCLFAFENGSIVGWNTMYYNEFTIYTRETYIRENYRSLALGFYLWYKTLKRIMAMDKYSGFKWLSFEFDKTNNRLLTLYEKLFEGAIINRVEQWSIVKNI